MTSLTRNLALVVSGMVPVGALSATVFYPSDLQFENILPVCLLAAFSIVIMTAGYLAHSMMVKTRLPLTVTLLGFNMLVGILLAGFNLNAMAYYHDFGGLFLVGLLALMTVGVNFGSLVVLERELIKDEIWKR